MFDPIEANRIIYDYLERLREDNPRLRYALRKSNYNNRLAQGYWFYGTETYIAVSFWSGMDWKNRTPNIAFFIDDRGECRLEINVSDSDRKREFVERFLVQQLGLESIGRRYVKRYWQSSDLHYLPVLNEFLIGNQSPSDQEIIDKVILENADSFFAENDNKIGLIDQYEFRSRNQKVEKYRTLLGRGIDANEDYDSKPNKLIDFRVSGFGELVDIHFDSIPTGNSWIFITGENGTGKTSLLRSIALTLGYKVLTGRELKDNPQFEVFARLNRGVEYLRSKNNNVLNKRNPMVSAMAMYGPNRLDSLQEKSTYEKFTSSLSKSGLFDSLFKSNAPLLDIENQFAYWTKNKSEKALEKRKYFIQEILTKIVPGLYDIRFEVKEGNKRVTKYILREKEEDAEKGVSWGKLPSGTKSVFGMVCDILIRLFHYQRDITDPSELTGIVIIDEVDLHLHPVAQKKLILDLTRTFPRVQFIASTHSPIPLLGAPPESVILRLFRSKDDGDICLERVEAKIDLWNTNPNILLTSPAFGFKEIFSEQYDFQSQINTQDTYDDLQFRKLVRAKLTNYLNSDTNDTEG
jgi:predicted ATP-binding protein involved in virulence